MPAAGDGGKRSCDSPALRGTSQETANIDGATPGFRSDAGARRHPDLGAGTAGTLENNHAGSAFLRPSVADGVAGELSGDAGLRGQFPPEIFPERRPCGDAAAGSQFKLPALAGACAARRALGEHGTGRTCVKAELRGDLESG